MGDAFLNWEGLRRAINSAGEHLRPPLQLKPSEWAERNVKIPAGNAIPGLIRLDNAPYQREPMDMAVDPACTRITLMWGAQVGKTMLALCVQGYHIDVKPSSQMMMQPSQGDLTTWLETKFNPLVDANPSLQNKIAKPRGRDGVNNQRMKSYPGGFMMFAWAGSTKTMRGRSAPLIVCDEVDGYEITQEGHPVGILWQRAATFGDQRLLFEISTPTTKDASYIEPAFEEGDQRRFYVACPHCGEHQTLKWSQVKWDKDKDGSHLPETAYYVCAASGCGTSWNDGERISAVRNAESVGAGWKAAKPFRGHASYHLNELYSCFRDLRDIVQSFLDKKATNDLQTFVNVSLAETWEEDGQQLDADGLQARVEKFRAPVPMGGVWLSCGVDMQQDRLEAEVVAWGVGDENWSVDYRVFWGDPLQQDVWDDLDDYLRWTWQHESGDHLVVSSTGIDTGGKEGMTQAAYEYCKGKQARRIFALKGVPGWGRPLVSSPSRKKTGKRTRPVDLFTAGVDELKLWTMKLLGIQRPGPGYCHFPEGRDPEWFEQITAEKLITRYVKGHPVPEWHKMRPRNEALDCRNYATAARYIMNPNLARIAQRMGVDLPGQDKANDKASPDMARTKEISNEPKVPDYLQRPYEYVKNTKGNATSANFIEDFEPIGAKLLQELKAAHLVLVIDGKLLPGDGVPADPDTELPPVDKGKARKQTTRKWRGGSASKSTRRRRPGTRP